MPKCTECGWEVNATDSFCSNCGAATGLGGKNQSGTIVTCGRCKGTGEIGDFWSWSGGKTCPTCKGKGKVRV